MQLPNKYTVKQLAKRNQIIQTLTYIKAWSCLRNPMITVIATDMIFFQFISVNSGAINLVNCHIDGCGVKWQKKAHMQKPAFQERQRWTQIKLNWKNIFWKPKIWVEGKFGAWNDLFFLLLKRKCPSIQIKPEYKSQSNTTTQLGV